ncbi:MAG: hypothetical protein PWQ31_261 [Eubacteriales bacterium]|nr:hypothetical protein [Eubacteriales bacterium]
MSVKPGKVKRHGFSVRFVHWTVTLSTFVLLFTGFGQMPIYRRYMVDRLPGLAWSSDFAVTLKLHYLAAAVLIFAVAYHITYHLIRRDFAILPRRGDLKESYLIIKAMLTGSKEPPSGKYLAEQRLAYAFIGANLLVLIITGIFKVLKNLPGVDFSPAFRYWITAFHNLATVLLLFGLLAHFAAFIFKDNRQLLPGMFTGYVDLDYVRRRHRRWYEELRRQGKIPASPCEEVDAASTRKVRRKSV